MSISDSKNGLREYTYDAADRVGTIKFSGTGQTPLRWDYSYNADGEVTEIKRYSDTSGTNLVATSLYGYDGAGRLTSITHKNASGTKIDDFNYTYDAAGRITQETSYLGPTRNYTYDKTNQLTGDGTDTYDWDANGNPSGSQYTIGTGNRLESDRTSNFVYDDEGNLTKKRKIATGEEWQYFFDHANKLTKVEHRPNATSPVDKRVEYGYDVFGNRIRRTVDADGDGAGSPVTEKFAYEAIDGEIGAVGDLDISQWNAWADLDASDDVTMRRLYQKAVDAVFARIDDLGNPAWYLTDNVGSVRDLIDNSGGLLDHLDYSPFGRIAGETNPTTGDRYKYTAREWDTETQLQYNRARYYDPTTRRWMSQDPLGFDAGDGNLYRYVKNEVTQRDDPSGLQITSPLPLVRPPAPPRVRPFPGTARSPVTRYPATAPPWQGASRRLDHELGEYRKAIANLRRRAKRLGLTESEVENIIQTIPPSVTGPSAENVRAVLRELERPRIARQLIPLPMTASEAQRKYYPSPPEAQPSPSRASVLSAMRTSQERRRRYHCGSLPTMRFSPANNMPNIAIHINIAQTFRGKPHILTRHGNPGLASQIRSNVTAIWRGRVPAGLSIDEYPFASTIEPLGYGSSVMLVPLVENRRQGGYISSFYRTYQIGVGGRFCVKGHA